MDLQATSPKPAAPHPGAAMSGLKNVRRRHTDALTHIGWERLEALLADHYRAQGYAVDHCGTGNTGSRFDGGIDLKLRKDDTFILVQCKHWNAKQVPHNAVHELLGLMVNHGATGAILVTSGEFTRAAVDSAARQGHVQLVDGDDLRAMLGPLPVLPSPAPETEVGALPASVARRPMAGAGERLLSAGGNRLRHGRGGRRDGGRRAGGVQSALNLMLLKFLFAAIIALILGLTLQFVVGSILQRASRQAPVPVVRPEMLPGPAAPPARSVLPESTRAGVGATVGPSPAGGLDRRPTSAEIRESQRKADEAMLIIEASTPEM